MNKKRSENAEDIAALRHFSKKFYQGHDILRSINSFIAIIRHAEKLIKTKNKAENSIILTEKGKKNAKDFGREFLTLYNDLSFIKTSPIKRCVKTAELVLQGANKNLEIILSNNLGDPGVFVIDNNLASELFKNNSCEKIVQYQIERKNLDGMRDIKSGVRILLEEILSNLKNIGERGIYITHDAILVPFISYLTGDLDPSTNWIDYLEGIYIWTQNEDSFLMWRGKKYNISNKIDILLKK